MHKNSNNRHSGRIGKPQGLERVDADPPYPPATANAVEQLRKLLASLIARAIADDCNKPPPAGDIPE
jgi:hypothetical protein